ncbi:MAG: hypothetical protein JOY57_00370, partial [Actinobacteria bacterium]|nr:hypothetical protein [Actinomycetota bacterium]
TGLPASVPVTVASPELAAGCAPGKAITAGISGPDANGRLTFNLSGVTCAAGIYRITFTETSAPNQTFTAFIKLTK